MVLAGGINFRAKGLCTLQNSFHTSENIQNKKNNFDVHVQEKYEVSFDKDIIFQSLDNTCRIWLIDSEGPLSMCVCSLK